MLPAAAAAAAFALLVAYLACVAIWLLCVGGLVLVFVAGWALVGVCNRLGRWVLTHLLTVEVVRRVSLGPSIGAAVRWGPESRRACALVVWHTNREARLLLGRDRGDRPMPFGKPS